MVGLCSWQYIGYFAITEAFSILFLLSPGGGIYVHQTCPVEYGSYFLPIGASWHLLVEDRIYPILLFPVSQFQFLFVLYIGILYLFEVSWLPVIGLNQCVSIKNLLSWYACGLQFRLCDGHRFVRICIQKSQDNAHNGSRSYFTSFPLGCVAMVSCEFRELFRITSTYVLFFYLTINSVGYHSSLHMNLYEFSSLWVQAHVTRSASRWIVIGLCQCLIVRYFATLAIPLVGWYNFHCVHCRSSMKSRSSFGYGMVLVFANHTTARLRFGGHSLNLVRISHSLGIRSGTS